MSTFKYIVVINNYNEGINVEIVNKVNEYLEENIDEKYHEELQENLKNNSLEFNLGQEIPDPYEGTTTYAYQIKISKMYYKINEKDVEFEVE